MALSPHERMQIGVDTGRKRENPRWKSLVRREKLSGQQYSKSTSSTLLEYSKLIPLELYTAIVLKIDVFGIVLKSTSFV